MPYWADRDLDLIRWPPFLLASKVSIFIFVLTMIGWLFGVILIIYC